MLKSSCLRRSCSRCSNIQKVVQAHMLHQLLQVNLMQTFIVLSSYSPILVIFLLCIYFFLQGVGAWSSKLKWNVWLDFKANISWNLTNYALEISYSYIAWEEVTFDVSIKLWKFNEGLGRTFLHMLLVSTINHIARQGNILFWHVRSLFIIWYNLCKWYFPMWGNLWFLFSINARIESSSKSILASN